MLPLTRSLSPSGQTLVCNADAERGFTQCLIALARSSSGETFAVSSTDSKPASSARDNAGRHVVREFRSGQERDVGAQWVVIPRPNPKAAIRLICIPHAGGGVSSFRGWSERLGIAEVGIVELPGRGSRLREPVVESVAAAADGLVETMASGPAAPAALFGHGLGALIAFEAARKLEARGWPMLALFVSGRRAPSLPAAGPASSRLSLEQLVEEAQRRSDVIPLDAALDRDSIRLLIPGVRADFAMLDGYVYQPGAPLRCPIVACGAASDPEASRNDQAAWRAETSARFSLHVFAGDASYLQREREAVTALIANQLSVMVSALARWSAIR